MSVKGKKPSSTPSFPRKPSGIYQLLLTCAESFGEYICISCQLYSWPFPRDQKALSTRASAAQTSELFFINQVTLVSKRHLYPMFIALLLYNNYSKLWKQPQLPSRWMEKQNVV